MADAVGEEEGDGAGVGEAGGVAAEDAGVAEAGGDDFGGGAVDVVPFGARAAAADPLGVGGGDDVVDRLLLRGEAAARCERPRHIGGVAGDRAARVDEDDVVRGDTAGAGLEVEDRGVRTGADDGAVSGGLGAGAKHRGFELDLQVALRDAGAEDRARLRVPGRGRGHGSRENRELGVVLRAARSVEGFAKRFRFRFICRDVLDRRAEGCDLAAFQPVGQFRDVLARRRLRVAFPQPFFGRHRPHEMRPPRAGLPCEDAAGAALAGKPVVVRVRLELVRLVEPAGFSDRVSRADEDRRAASRERPFGLRASRCDRRLVEDAHPRLASAMSARICATSASTPSNFRSSRSLRARTSSRSRP
ncbi:MAG: hypothetical protein FD180_3318 [Planctomycetota bacterium]|nr:MAG: hypothetical protein FD180_3318 [Planctomycetota bacterium]